MADLTDNQLTYLHDHLGTAASEDDMQERYDRLGDVDLVIVETLRRRLSDLLATPSSFSVAGEYSQNTSDNIKTVQAKLLEFQTRGDVPRSLVRISRPSRAPYR